MPPHPLTPLEVERVTLLDLLIGRVFRLNAQEAFEAAVVVSPQHEPTGDDCLQRAAHMEWIAQNAERGAIKWGSRLNRCGAPE